MPCPNKSSVYTGVSYHKYRKKYEAYVHLGKRRSMSGSSRTRTTQHVRWKLKDKS